MNMHDTLTATIAEVIQPGKGILAADESLPTISKRFKTINLEPTETNRRDYRIMLFGTPELDRYISGVILFEETLFQKTDDGVPLPNLLQQQKIMVGAKADTGNGLLTGARGDIVTRGLDGLETRLQRYKKQGARFAKWREVYPVGSHNPTVLGRKVNAGVLARYAAVCQQQGIVPIVEPEVLMDGSHSLERCAEVTEHVLHSVFHALHQHGILLEGMILKPNMVVPGRQSGRAAPEEVAAATLKVLMRAVPAAVPGINFLSGGQGPEEATANLNAINSLGHKAPWSLGISFGRALQQPALQLWNGKAENIGAARAVLLKRARLNSLAKEGRYSTDMELET